MMTRLDNGQWKLPNKKPNKQQKKQKVVRACGVIVFNGDSVCPWQAYENTVVMVTNRIKEDNGKFIDHFCRAADVIKGDNVWEHNIVEKIELIAEPRINVKMHYGQEKEGPGFVEEIEYNDWAKERLKENIDWNDF